MEQKENGSERREFARIKKHFIIRFVQKNNLTVKYEVSQVENISKGGMSFSSSMSFAPNTELLIELRTPYMAETVHLGLVIGFDDRQCLPGAYEHFVQFLLLLVGERLLRFGRGHGDHSL